MVAAGAVGALGTAIAIGVTTQAHGTTDTTQEAGPSDQPGTRSGDHEDRDDLSRQLGEDQQQPAPNDGQLAVPGRGAPQAHSSGS